MNQFLALLSHDEKQLVIHPIDAPQRRAWANPELYLFHNGIRLENVDEVVGTAVHSVIQTTFSPEGCQKALSAMKTNEFLGELVRMPLGCSICDPIISSSLEALQRPSHLGGYFTGIISVLACIWKTQIVVAPTFIGAEPNVIDRGTQQGTQILQSEQDLGLRFMQSLSKELQSKAQIFKTTQPPEVPEDRWNPQTSGIFAGLVRIIVSCRTKDFLWAGSKQASFNYSSRSSSSSSSTCPHRHGRTGSLRLNDTLRTLSSAGLARSPMSTRSMTRYRVLLLLSNSTITQESFSTARNQLGFTFIRFTQPQRWRLWVRVAE